MSKFEYKFLVENLKLNKFVLAFHPLSKKFLVSKRVQDSKFEILELTLAEMRELAADDKHFMNRELFLSWIKLWFVIYFF